jgi:hypothetical protein
MKCATARPPAPPVRWAVGLLTAAAFVARSAAAQELEPLPAPPPDEPPPFPGGAAPAAPPAAAPSPPSTAPSPPPRPAPSEVRFEPDESDVSLLQLSQSVPVERGPAEGYERWLALYSPVCHGPCSTQLDPGAYRLALAKGGRVVPVHGPVVVHGPVTLRGDYIDRSGLRATGLILGVAGTIGGFVMVVASAQNGAVCDVNGICVSRGTTNVPLLAVGVSLLVASVVVGSVLTFQRDDARITIEPLVLPSRAAREGSLTAFEASQPQGGAIALHF